MDRRATSPGTEPGGLEDGWSRLLTLLAPVHDELRALARRIARSPSEGDDLFQEAALRAMRKLPDLRDEDRFRGWFTRILLSVHRSRSRRRFWARFVPLDDGDGEDAIADHAADAGDDPGDAERASRALATLPAVQREAIVLCDIEGFAIAEIAALQRASSSAVKSRLSRGRSRLRRYYRRLQLLEDAPAASAVSGAAKGDLS